MFFAAVVAVAGLLTVGGGGAARAVDRTDVKILVQAPSGFDPAALDTPEMRQALLDSLINQRIVSQTAET